MRSLSQKIARAWHWITLAVTSGVILYWLFPELTMQTIYYNDGVSHTAFLRGMDEAWSSGGSILDFWMPNVNFGHAVFRSYQILSYLVIWAAHKTVFRGLSIDDCFNLCITLVAMAAPWVHYLGWRLLGLRRIDSVAAAVAAALAHEALGYGIGLTNFTFSGYGTYTQLFANTLFPLALGCFHKMLRTNQYGFRAALAFCAVFMSHILGGYFLGLAAALDLALLLVFERPRASVLAKRIGHFAGNCAVMLAFWLIPMFQDARYQRRSTNEMPYKWTGHGAEKMLTDFFNGSIIDDGRLPILTYLGVAGFFLCAWLALRFVLTRRPESEPRPLAQVHFGSQGLLWLLLSFGPTTWGMLLEGLPMSRSVHWHRAFAVTQLFWMACTGIAVGSVWRWLNPKDESRTRAVRLVNLGASFMLLALGLYPILKERQHYFYVTNTHWLKDSLTYWGNPSEPYHKLLEFAQTNRQGRYHAGLTDHWGNDLKVSNTTPLYALLVQFNLDNIGSIHHHQSHAETLAYSGDWSNRRHLEIMNARYVALKADAKAPKDFREVVRTRNAALYDVGDLGGFFEIGEIVPGGCADNALVESSIKDYLRSPLIAAHRYPEILLRGRCDSPPFLTAAVTTTTPTAGVGSSEKILSTHREVGDGIGDVFRAKVSLSKPAAVVFKMAFHPNWRIRVNGALTEKHLVLPFFPAIQLSAGVWEIEARYESDSVKKGLTWFSALGTLALAALGWSRRRKRRESEAT